MVNVPINPVLLSWAMETSQLKPQDIAKVTRRTPETVMGWLEGSTQPTKTDVQKFGKLLGRSSHFFLLNYIPEDAAISPKFRKSVRGESGEPAKELASVRRANRYQRVIRSAVANEMTVKLPARVASAEAYAQIMRDFLGWDTRAKQIDATSKSATFRNLRTTLESAGLSVVYLQMGEDNCRGFSLPDPHAPLIAINASYKSPALKSFTVLHELAHIAAGESSICRFEDTTEERWCDSFAAAFLLPDSEVRSYFATKKWHDVQVHELDTKVRLVAQRFRSSWTSAAIRLRDLGLAGQAVVDEVFSRNYDMAELPGFARGGGRRTPAIRLDEFGETYARAVLSLNASERLSEYDTQKYLNVDRKQLNELKLLVGGAH